MPDEPLDTSWIDSDDSAPYGDSRDVVEGPVGSARLVEPDKLEPRASDLDGRPGIDIDDGAEPEVTTRPDH